VSQTQIFNDLKTGKTNNRNTHLPIVRIFPPKSLAIAAGTKVAGLL